MGIMVWIVPGHIGWLRSLFGLPAWLTAIVGPTELGPLA
jgi:hypothetical protein